MGTVPTLPQVASIAPVQSAENGVASTNDIQALIGGIADQASQPLPQQYVQGTQVATPTMPHQHQFETNRNTNNTPITGQVADVKRARRQNAVANLGNAISTAGEAIQAKKTEKLKNQLTDVMKAKTNVANAQQVLNDPNSNDTTKQMATKVLEANKKQLDTILSDPKNQKSLAKALDISFVDPEKNKTPEVQAFQAAKKEFDSNGPFNSDNPQEHAVAQAAAKEQTQQPMQPQKPNLGVPQAPQARPMSATPYADKALAKDTPSIETNPQYAAVAAQKAAAQKQLATLIPHLIDTQSKAQIQAARDGNAAAREVYKDAMQYQRTAMQEIGKLEGIDMQDKNRMAVENRKASTEMAATAMRVSAALKIADKNAASREAVAAIKKNAVDDVDKKINAIEQVEKSWGQRENDIKQLPKDQRAAAQKTLDTDMSLTHQRREFYENQKRKALGLPELPPTAFKKPDGPGLFSRMKTEADSEASNLRKMLGIDKDEKPPEVKPVAVGSDEADEDDTTLLDSDNYGHDGDDDN